MIKNLQDISEKDFEYMKSHPIEVYEKLDLIRFNIECFYSNGVGAVEIKTSKGSVIDEVDCVVNTVMNDIVDFVNNNISNKVKDILEECNGECIINMLYAPVNRTHVIEYEKFDCPLFIMSNVQSSCSDGFDKVRKILIHISHLSFLRPNVMDCLPESLNPNGDALDNIRMLIGNDSWSLNDVDDIEGCIIKCGRKTYQIIGKDTRVNIDKTTKKIYRDMMIDNFCNVILENKFVETISDKSDGYFDIMSKLFLYYLDKTTIFSRVSFDPDDLLPPTVGYIGDINYDRLPVAIRYVCKSNVIYENLLKIFLVAFDPHKTKIKKDTDIDYERFQILKNQINIKISNR